MILLTHRQKVEHFETKLFFWGNTFYNTQGKLFQLWGGTLYIYTYIYIWLYYCTFHWLRNVSHKHQLAYISKWAACNLSVHPFKPFFVVIVVYLLRLKFDIEVYLLRYLKVGHDILPHLFGRLWDCPVTPSLTTLLREVWKYPGIPIFCTSNSGI